MTLSTRRVIRCRILNEGTRPIGIGQSTLPRAQGVGCGGGPIAGA